MANEKERHYCIIDHANKQIDRLRVIPGRASTKPVPQREVEASKEPPRDADLVGEQTGTMD